MGAKAAREKRKRERRKSSGADGAMQREQTQLKAQTTATAESGLAEKKRKKGAKVDSTDEAEAAIVSCKAPKRDPQLTVFVGQLPFTADARAIEEHFAKGGVEDAISVRMLMEKWDPNKSRGMAFVQLASEKDVLRALKLHQSELCGRWIN